MNTRPIAAAALAGWMSLAGAAGASTVDRENHLLPNLSIDLAHSDAYLQTCGTSVVGIFRIRVENRGVEPSPALGDAKGLTIASDSGTWTGGGPIPAIASGGNTTVTVTMSPVSYGIQRFTIVANGARAFGETDYSDNTAHVSAAFLGPTAVTAAMGSAGEWHNKNLPTAPPGCTISDLASLSAASP